MRVRSFLLAIPIVVLCRAGLPAAPDHSSGGVVHVTPLGSHAGELCRNDRALLFEDPTGLRLLYDPGRTVDENDPRLGAVHAMILSHVHVDHSGDVRPNTANPGTCAVPATAAANPQSNFATIAAAKNAAVLVPGELSAFFARKIQNVRAVPTPACPAVTIDNRIDVPRTSPCTASIRPGGSFTVSNGGAGSVRIAAVQAIHSNGINAGLIDPPGVAPGLTGYGGDAVGFVVTFTNGLTAYLTGDSGMFGDQETIIARFYKANLMVINMSDQVTFGPREAAFVTRELVRPRTVMPSHVNEAATSGGQIVAGTRVALFESLLRHDVGLVLPLSDLTRAFDGDGRCANCD
jgi:hypothetical protein